MISSLVSTFSKENITKVLWYFFKFLAWDFKDFDVNTLSFKNEVGKQIGI